MAEFVEVKTAELNGPALRYAVATAEGLGDELRWCFNEDGAFHNIWTDNHGAYWPDEDWEIGGPLLEKYGVCILQYHEDCHDLDENNTWTACMRGDDNYFEAPTPLIAACRAIVAAKIGETVSAPKELMPC